MNTLYSEFKLFSKSSKQTKSQSPWIMWKYLKQHLIYARIIGHRFTTIKIIELHILCLNTTEKP